MVEYSTTLVEGDKADLPRLRQDDNLNKLNTALKDHPAASIPVSLFGPLDVAKPIPDGATLRLGYIFDKSGKNIGTYGFVNPVAIYKYRLVLLQVNTVSEAPTS